MSQTAAAKSRDGFIDALRGLAVLFVVFSHTSNVGLHILPFVDAHGSGKIGVWLFFVISAYLLSGHLLERLRGGAAIGPQLVVFFVNRAFRILPLYVCVLILHYWLGDLTSDSLRNHLMFAEGQGEFWALPVEVKYYLCIPVVVLFHLHVRSLRVTAAAAAVVAAGVLFAFPPSLAAGNSISLWPYLAIFATGSLLAVLESDRPSPPRGTAGVALLCLLLIALSMPSILGRVAPSVTVLDLHGLGPLYGLAWAAVLLGARPLAAGCPALLLGALAAVGRWSFSIYLLHLPILDAIQATTAMPAAGAVVLVLTLAVSAISWYVLERPGIALGRRLGRALARSMSGAAERLAG